MSSSRQKLVVPSAVAVVGASHLGGGNYYGARVMSNLVATNGSLTVYPVNPRYRGEEILGRRVFGTLSELPSVPELAIICTPVKVVDAILDEAGRIGVSTCVVISNEQGDEPARRAFDAAVARRSRQYDMCVIGPNSMGVLNGNAMLNGSFSTGGHDGTLSPGNVAVVSQSGAVIAYLLQVFKDSKLGYSWLVSTGNEAGASFEELVEQVVEDEASDVILLFIEGVADGERMRRVALTARLRRKAVAMLVTGLSKSGKIAVQSHTGRIAGSDDVYRAFQDESGVLRATGYQQLYDYAKALSEQAVKRRARPHRRRAVVVTTSGGAGSFAADCFSALGWRLPDIRSDVRAAMERMTGQHIGNPVDITGVFGNPALLNGVLRELAADHSIDAVLLASGAGGQLAGDVAQAVAAARPVMPQEVYAGWLGMSAEVARIFEDGAVSAYDDISRAVLAAEASARFRDGASALQETRELLALLEQRRADRVATGDRHDPPAAGLWTAGTTMSALRGWRVECARFALTSCDADEAAAAATSIGYPVAVKLDSAQMSHKSDVGAVELGVADGTDLRGRVRRLRGLAESAGIADPKIVVQEMLAGIEVLVGLKWDAAFGLLLVVGLGGTRAELEPHFSTLLLPAVPAAFDRLIASHRTLSTLLRGYRGAPAANVKALTNLLEAFSAWALAQGPGLVAADLNPVVVNEDGAFVVDARAEWS